MDLKRMEVFCKIVELKSFTHRGEALSLAQPTVSEHIRALETMLGEKLLDRFKGDVLPLRSDGCSISMPRAWFKPGTRRFRLWTSFVASLRVN